MRESRPGHTGLRQKSGCYPKSPELSGYSKPNPVKCIKDERDIFLFVFRKDQSGSFVQAYKRLFSGLCSDPAVNSYPVLKRSSQSSKKHCVNAWLIQ